MLLKLLPTLTIHRAPPKAQLGGEGPVYRVPPYYYLHVLDQTSNVTRLEIGPITFVRKDNEQVPIMKTSQYQCLYFFHLGPFGPREDGYYPTTVLLHCEEPSASGC